MQRVLVIGASGSGKSTLAARLAERAGLPYVATDPLCWGEHWRPVPVGEVHRRAAGLAAGAAWVMDGNFDGARAAVWARADTIVWLDYPPWVVWPRVLRRNVGWALGKTSVWSGNTMTLSRAWSGVRHSVRTYGGKRRDYPGYLAEFPRACVLRFRSPRAAAHWLAGV